MSAYLTYLISQLKNNSPLVSYFILIVAILSLLYNIYNRRKKNDSVGNANDNLKPKSTNEKHADNETCVTPAYLTGPIDVLDIRPPTENPNFIGRNEILRSISEKLNSGKRAYVIYGTAGTGKTEVAAAYLQQHRDKYKYRWWLPAEDLAVLKNYYASIKMDLESEPDFPNAACVNITSTINVLKRWLEKDHGWKWLIVLDNAMSPKDIEEYIPREGGAGHLIVTSRDASSAWDNVAYSYQLKEFERDEAVEFLIKRTGQEDIEGAKSVAFELGSLPLALEQAGTYIKNTNRNFSEYLIQLRSDKIGTLSLHEDARYHEPISRTWNISFGRVQKEMPLSGNILYICSYLSSEQIPLRILDQGIEHLEQPAPTLSSVNNAIVSLKRYSLVTGAPGSLTIHKLVQDVIRYRLAEEGQEEKWSGSAVKLIDSVFSYKESDSQTWAECATLLPHALAVTKYAENAKAEPETVSHLLNKVGLYLEEIAEFFKAKDVLERALEIDKKVYRREHLNVARDYNNLGGALRGLGKLEEAKKCFEKALEIDKKVYGPDHPSVAIDINNLGLALQDLGELEEAKKCYEKALIIATGICGPDHPNVAIVINNLGSMLKDQREFQEAKKCFEKALEIDEKVYGPSYPSVAIYINNLGKVLKDLGELEEAKECFEKALEIDKKVYGPDHPSVAKRINNLGSVLEDLGELQEARVYYERAVEIYVARLGENHPETNLVKANLVRLHALNESSIVI